MRESTGRIPLTKIIIENISLVIPFVQQSRGLIPLCPTVIPFARRCILYSVANNTTKEVGSIYVLEQTSSLFATFSFDTVFDIEAWCRSSYRVTGLLSALLYFNFVRQLQDIYDFANVFVKYLEFRSYL